MRKLLCEAGFRSPLESTKGKSMNSLKHLFSPIRIGNMEVKNRLVMAPMSTNLASTEGHVTEALIHFLKARAQGGVGVIITGDVSITGSARYTSRGLSLCDNECIQGWSNLARAVHACDAKIAPQLIHPGSNAHSSLSGVQPVAASPIASRRFREIPKELRYEEIQGIIDQFGDAALRAREAGCDAVQLHCAHNHHLLGGFLSALNNKRTDAYGGDIHGRLKLILQVIQCIRSRVGPGFPILVRISGDEFEPGGQTIQETRYIAPLLVEAGADALHISAGTHNKTWLVEPPTGSPHATNASLAAAIKEVVNVPVISVGRIIHPWVAESVLASGQADMVAMGRALLADPEFPNKVASGDWDTIAPCVGDLYCLTRLYNDKRISCLVNATVGQEQDAALAPAEHLKKILVIGGGPAGLEASRMAALRGHHVTLVEKNSQLGGQLSIASFPPTKQEFTCLIQYLIGQVYRAGVAVELNREGTSGLIEEFHPDAVIISTGGMPMIPRDIPGIEGDNVVTGWDILAGKVLPKRTVLVIGGGSVGCETADFITHPVNDLNPQGNRVTIMEMLDNVCLDDLSPRRSLLIQRLLAKGVRIMTRARVTEVLPDGVRYRVDEQEKTLRGIDTIVLATGTRAENLLAEELKNSSTPFFLIGDAKEPRRAGEAIAEGWEIGRKI